MRRALERGYSQQATQPMGNVTAGRVQDESILGTPGHGAQIGVFELHLLDLDLAAHVGPRSTTEVNDRIRAIMRGAFEKHQITSTRVHQEKDRLLLKVHFDDGVTWAPKSRRRTTDERE